ncbi:DUF4935 domain-containing protein [Leptospira santarosai]|nr:DUF4935 domain-containing protein [Leptospira santarosai]
METLKIFLDTSIFRQDETFESAQFIAIKNYCKAGIVQLFTSVICENELLSHIEIQVIESIEKIRKEQEKLESLIPGYHGLFTFKHFINEERADLIKKYKLHWKLFKKDTRLRVLGFDYDISRQALENYFSGGAPYKSRKNREDIPDSFIFETILKKFKNNQDLIVITQDKRLLVPLLDKGVTCFSSMQDAFTGSIFYNVIAELYGKPNRKLIGSLISYNHVKVYRALRIELNNFYIDESDNYESLLNTLAEDFMEELEVDIKYIYESLTVSLKKIQIYSRDYVSLPFKIDVALNLSYKVRKSEVFRMSKDRYESVKYLDSYDHKYDKIDEEKFGQIAGVIGVLFTDMSDELNLDTNLMILTIESIKLSFHHSA